MESCSLYRFFNADGELLYVGVTLYLPVRLRQHERTQDWWHDVVRVDVEHFESRSDAEAAERLAIETEKPRWNVRWTEADPTLGPRPRPSRPRGPYVTAKRHEEWLARTGGGNYKLM